MAFPDNYLRSGLRLEISPLASWLPNEEKRLSCYAVKAFPKVFENRQCTVKVIRPERTFWEKANILHREANRPEGSPQPHRYSRHYYDLMMIDQSPVNVRALADLGLLAGVVEFKQRFYPRGCAGYDLAKPARHIGTGAGWACVGLHQVRLSGNGEDDFWKGDRFRGNSDDTPVATRGNKWRLTPIRTDRHSHLIFGVIFVNVHQSMGLILRSLLSRLTVTSLSNAANTYQTRP